MGKTTNTVQDFTALAKLRSSAPTPDYILTPGSKRQDGPAAGVLDGYWRPEFLIDAANASVIAGCCLPVVRAVHLPPFSAVYADKETAKAEMIAVAAAANKEADHSGSVYFGLPELENANLARGHSVRFRERWPGNDRYGEISLVVDWYTGAIDPTLPLIIARNESDAERKLYASARYAYCPVLKEWFLIERRGSGGQSAYLRSYKRATAAEAASSDFIGRTWGQIRDHRQLANFSHMPELK